MGISIIIPTWNGRALLERLFASLAAVHFSDADEIIVADGNSSDGTQGFVRSVAEESSPRVKLVPLYQNFGFSGNVNAGLREANSENDVVIMNNDVLIPDPGVFQLLWEIAHGQADLGVVSPVILSPDGHIEAHGAGHLPFSHLGKTWSAGELMVGQHLGLRECEVVPFVCAFIKRKCLDAVGSLDEDFFAYFDERIPYQTRWWLREPSAPVFIYRHPVPDFALGGIYTQGDCFVLPTSGEGWCLTALEALACGAPVIVTDWSAPTEWGKDEQGQPLPGMNFLDYDLVECRSDILLYRDSVWAKPSYDHLRKLMRAAYEGRNEWKKAALAGSEIVREKYTWRAVGERIRERLEDIEG